MNLLYGSKTVLRRFEERLSDAELAKLYEWSRDRELLAQSGGTPTDLSLPEFREHVRGERFYGPTNRRMFLILTRDTMELIGRVGVFAVDWNRRDAELGIVIGAREFQNRGYGRDAIKTLLRHLFTTSSLSTVYLYTLADNLRARRAFAAVGFRVTEQGARYTPDVGEFDGVKMELTRQEFLDRERGETETIA